MQNPNRSPLIEFIQNSRPFSLLAGILLYGLGAGLVVFRGDSINWKVYWLGQGCVTLLQLSSFYLQVYYDRLLNPSRRRERSENHPRPDLEERAARNVYLLTAITTLTVFAMLTVLLVNRGALSPGGYLLLGLASLIAFFYSVPPLRLANTGYGDLAAAVLLTNLLPGFSFTLQAGELIQVLGVMTLPLTILYIAMSLATSLEHYYDDIKRGKQTLMNRLGWQRGMFLHNLCVLVVYVTIGLTTLFGFPWSLTWPRLLTLPIGLFQVWQIWQIGNGAKPHWRLLRFTAYATFAIMVYLQAFTLWVL